MTQEHADVWIRDKVYDKTNATENTKSASNPPLLPFRIRVGVGMNRSARDGKKCKAR